MKFGYAIVLALIALVAVSGFASADRLPQQVPENQIFTISTLIDVTGAVSENSQMALTIISGERVLEGIIWDTSAADPTERYVLSADELAVLQAAAAAWASEFGGVAGDYLSVSGNNLNWLRLPVGEESSLIGETVNTRGFDTLLMSGKTWTQYMADIDTTNPEYISNSVTYPSAIANDMLRPGEEIALLTWTDSLRTNGGKLSLNKKIDFDSRNKGKGLYNLEVEKVLTYNSVEGAHLIGGEEWILDVAGSWEKSADSIRCVFAAGQTEYFPAFCNVVKAKSELININSAQISTKGAARAIAATGDIPAALNYQIAVSPDANTGSGFADGTVKTLFGGSIMEARGKNLVPSATNNWKDEASVTGGIKNFQKVFTYESGFTF